MNSLIKRLATVYGHPEFADDPRAYLAELNRLIGHYSEPVLEHAANKLIREHTPTQRNPWPSPATIAKACSEAAGTWGKKAPGRSSGEWSTEAVAKAYDLVVTPMGRTAADDGWVLGLWDFCRKHGRLPERREIDRIKDGAAGFDRSFADATRIPPPLGVALSSLGETMLARREKLSRMAHGEIIEREKFEMSETSRRMTGDRE